MKQYSACAHAARIHSVSMARITPNKIPSLARKACDANIAAGCAYLISPNLHGFGRAPDKAIEYAEKSCREDDAFGCDWLGNMYKSGDGVPVDLVKSHRFLAKAMALYRQQCDKGYEIGCYRLAMSYDGNEESEQNAEKTILLFQQACDARIALACSRLSNHYRYNEDLAKDEQKAMFYQEKSCDFGDPSDCYFSGSNYSYGSDGAVKDVAKAARMWQKGCDLDDDSSCENLADLYNDDEEENGIAPDKSRAVALYKKAFLLRINGCHDDEDASACESLGDAYKEGKTVKPDPVKADEAYKKAISLWQRDCDHDDYISCFALASMYEKGKGVEKNIPRALEYYDKACTQYYPGCLWKASLSGKSK
ncbi:MAG: hypothetical protein LBQ81_10020 [Zoogloeaceae bacterium]|nr:hypothetical protein [Zoogloeaceae bacterium]